MPAARLLRELFPTICGIRLSPTQRSFLPVINTICVAGTTWYLYLKCDRIRNANKLREENDRLRAEYEDRCLKLAELRKTGHPLKM